MIAKTNNGYIPTADEGSRLEGCTVVVVPGQERMVLIKDKNGDVFCALKRRDAVFLPSETQKVRRAFYRLTGVTAAHAEAELKKLRDAKVAKIERGYLDGLRRRAALRGYKLVKA